MAGSPRVGRRSAWRCELIPPESPRWGSLLTRVAHDFYHLPGYARLSGRVQGGEACALLVSHDRGEMLLPLVLRDIAGTGRDAESPYGYPGPLTAGSDDPAFLAHALGAASGFLAGQGLVTLFVRTHPLLGDVPRGIGTIVTHGDTVTIDVRRSEEDARNEMRRGHRSQIDRARRAGHRVILDAGPEHDASFRRLYRATMARLGVDPFYHFADWYFAELREILGDRLHLAVVEIEGETAAAALFVETQGLVQYHLSGSDERFSREAPTKLMIDAVRRWARDRGDRWLHLGGGVGFSEDGLFRFKAGFSKLRTPFRSLRVILRPSEYERLVGTDASAGPALSSVGFFPPYRRAGSGGAGSAAGGFQGQGRVS